MPSDSETEASNIPTRITGYRVYLIPITNNTENGPVDEESFTQVGSGDDSITIYVPTDSGGNPVADLSSVASGIRDTISGRTARREIQYQNLSTASTLAIGATVLTVISLVTQNVLTASALAEARSQIPANSSISIDVPSIERPHTQDRGTSSAVEDDPPFSEEVKLYVTFSLPKEKNDQEEQRRQEEEQKGGANASNATSTR